MTTTRPGGLGRRLAPNARPVRTAAVIALLGSATLAGCGGPTPATGDGLSTGLTALDDRGLPLESITGDGERDDKINALIERAGEGLDALGRGEYDPMPSEAVAARTESAPRTATPGTTPMVRRIGDADASPETLVDAATLEPVGPETVAEAEPVLTFEERVHGRAAELRALLASAVGDPDRRSEMVETALALALIEGASGALPHSGVTTQGQRLTDFETLGRGALSPEERAAVGAVRDFASELAASTAREGSLDRGALWRLLDGALGEVSEAGGVPLTATTTALCTRVRGFGLYDELAANPGFLAGQTNPVIIYTEVDGFASRSAGSAGAAGSASERAKALKAVEIAQRVELYHDADGVLAWQAPRRVTRQESRRRIRDLFITNRVDLPRRLTVGGYRLKVITEDVTTGAVAEVSVPIRIVADRGLAAVGG